MDILDVARALGLNDDQRESLAQFSSDVTEQVLHAGVRLLDRQRSLNEQMQRTEDELDNLKLELEEEIKEYEEELKRQLQEES